MNLDHVFKKTKTALKKSESTTTVPDGLLCRCSRCKKPILVQEVRDAYYICPKCGGYFKVRAYERIRRVADEGTFQESDRDLVGENPLGFEGYEEKLAAERLKTRMKEAIVTGTGSIDGIPAALGVMDSRFMMASMGWAVGEKLTRLIEKATTENLPLILFIRCNGKAPRGRTFVCLCIDRSDHWRCDSELCDGRRCDTGRAQCADRVCRTSGN